MIIIFKLLMLTISLVFSQTEYPGTNIFSSSEYLGRAGSGYLKPSSISLKQNPAAVNDFKLFSTGRINFKNGISSQSVGLTFPYKKRYISTALVNVNYGVFKSYDEKKNYLGTYTSSDNWFSVSYAEKVKKVPIRVGLSFQSFFSSLGGYEMNDSFISAGFKISLEKIKTELGLSYHQLDIFAKGKKWDIEPNTVFSISKILAHLPLNLFSDFVLNNYSNTFEVFGGGIFNLSNNLELHIGTSSRKGNQNFNNRLFNSIFGSSGFGLTYIKMPYSINFGSYIYGNGFIISGIQLDIKI